MLTGKTPSCLHRKMRRGDFGWSKKTVNKMFVRSFFCVALGYLGLFIRVWTFFSFKWMTSLNKKYLAGNSADFWDNYTPQNLTWIAKLMGWKMHLLSQMAILIHFGIYVKFLGCSEFTWPWRKFVLRDLEQSGICSFLMTAWITW